MFKTNQQTMCDPLMEGLLEAWRAIWQSIAQRNVVAKLMERDCRGSQGLTNLNRMSLRVVAPRRDSPAVRILAVVVVPQLGGCVVARPKPIPKSKVVLPQRVSRTIIDKDVCRISLES